MEVLEEFMQKDGREHTALLKASQALAKSPALKKEGLLGALWSSDELIVDPREAIRNIPAVLSQQYDVEFHFNAHVRELDAPYVWVGGQKIGSRANLGLFRTRF